MNKEIVLSYFPKITHKRYRELSAAFSSWKEIKRAGLKEIQQAGWSDENLIHQFLLWRDGINEEKIEKILEQELIHCVTEQDKEYPDLLKKIYDPPFCLFVRGAIPAEAYCLAVVGTRKYTAYGKQVTEELVGELTDAGMAIISGMALGIDGIAHAACLGAGGKTVAVLGSGINRQHIYPAAHKTLAEKIIAGGGAVISEYPPGALPSKFTFPKRNRIIAGMSLGALITEAGEDSGALITAQCALDSGREVFTVPHNITSLSGMGPNILLKLGAHPVTNANDIIDTLNLQDLKLYVTNKAIIPESPTEEKILLHLSREPIHIDNLTKQSGLDSPTINSALTLMEMKGKVKNLGGMMYVLSR